VDKEQRQKLLSSLRNLVLTEREKVWAVRVYERYKKQKPDSSNTKLYSTVRKWMRGMRRLIGITEEDIERRRKERIMREISKKVDRLKEELKPRPRRFTEFEKESRKKFYEWKSIYWKE